MSTSHTQHYSLDDNLGKTKLVLDTWKSQAMLIDNDVLPESKECPVIPGFENVATSLSMNGAHFTTIPLNPMSRDVNFLYQNYITIKTELTFAINADENLLQKVLTDSGKICIYTPSTAMLPSRIMLLSGNSIVWNNQYQRQEALVTMCSLPQGVITKSCDYTTISKLINNENYPGISLSLKNVFKKETNANDILTLKVKLNLNIDINQLSPILSNIIYTTPDMGSLRLRLFFENLEDAFSWSYIPYIGVINETVSTIPLEDRKSYKLEQLRIQLAQLNASQANLAKDAEDYQTQYDTIQNNIDAVVTKIQEAEELPDDPNDEFYNANMFIDRIPLGINHQLLTHAKSKIMISLIDWKLEDEGLTITQSCFSVREESKIEMKKYIAQDNKLIIPTQCWNCILSNNMMSPKDTRSSLTFNVSAYNVNTVAFLFPKYKDKLIFSNPIFKSFNCKYNSKSLCYVPYGSFDKRMIKDTIQSLINDDYYAVNENLFDSIAPAILNTEYEELKAGNDIAKDLSFYDLFTCDVVKSDSKTIMNNQFLKYPNLFTIAFNVSPVNAFEKGFSVASSNQGVIQIRIDFVKEDSPIIRNIYTSYKNWESDLISDDYKVFPAEETQALCLCLCDCCLVLDYNPIVGSVQTGSVVFAEPFIV